ncbi:hypothetical protein TNCV_2111511 [Trichonephila clavipes]|nr:hypothetical protein TNCV_2111511 [Trichonephila clavipes]
MYLGLEEERPGLRGSFLIGELEGAGGCSYCDCFGDIRWNGNFSTDERLVRYWITNTYCGFLSGAFCQPSEDYPCTGTDTSCLICRGSKPFLCHGVEVRRERAALLAIIYDNNPRTQGMLDCRHHLKHLASFENSGEVMDFAHLLHCPAQCKTFLTERYWEDRATRGLLATDHVILNHGQVTWTTPELAPPSPNYHTTPTGGRFSSRQI